MLAYRFEDLPETSRLVLPPELDTYIEIAVFRHGRSKANGQYDIIQGSGPDPSNTLDELGEEQARNLAGTLLGLGIIATGVWSSELPRARRTCDINMSIMDCPLMVWTDARLNEMCKGLSGRPGGMEGRLRSEVETRRYWAGYKKEGWHFRHGSLLSGGQTAEEVGLRFHAALDDIADQLATRPLPNRPGWRPMGLVYTHAQAARYGVGSMLGWPDIEKIDQDYRLANCEGLVLRRYDSDHQWEVRERITPTPVATISQT